jgi:putative flippase GtrA
MSRAAFQELVRFGIVGVLQNGVNVGVFAAALALDAPYQLCAALAAVAALVASFGLNRSFTFTETSDHAVGSQLWRYVIVFVVAILASIAVLTFFVEVAGLAKVLAQVVAIIIIAPFHFLAQKHWTFRSRAPA